MSEQFFLYSCHSCNTDVIVKGPPQICSHYKLILVRTNIQWAGSILPGQSVRGGGSATRGRGAFTARRAVGMTPKPPEDPNPICVAPPTTKTYSQVTSQNVGGTSTGTSSTPSLQKWNSPDFSWGETDKASMELLESLNASIDNK